MSQQKKVSNHTISVGNEFLSLRNSQFSFCIKFAVYAFLLCYPTGIVHRQLNNCNADKLKENNFIADQKDHKCTQC